jgi:hypothetical protein
MLFLSHNFLMLNNNPMIRIFYSILILSFVLGSCTSDVTEKDKDQDLIYVAELNSEVATKWAELYLGIETHLAGFRPAATSRAMAYVAMTAYETAIPGMPNYRSLSDVLNVPNLPKVNPAQKINFNLALNAAYKEITLDMMHSTNLSQTNEILKLFERLKSEYGSNEDSEVVVNSENWGVRVARAISAYAATDAEGHRQARDPRPASYTPPTGQGAWEPTPPFRLGAMYPYWGRTRLLASTENEIKVTPPPPYSTKPGDKYYDDFKEVYDEVSKNDFRTQWQAEFWSDDIVGLTFSPPARNLAIAVQLIDNERLNLEETLDFLLILGIGSNDAAIAAWKGKYETNVERPITFIRKHIDPNFNPTLGRAIGAAGLTPDFPGYPSGHSTFGGLASSVFTHYFGEQYTFTDNCHKNRIEFYGIPRTFHTFSELGEENAFSRIPLGVHPRFDCEEGLRLGRLLGENAANLRLKK